MDTKILRQNFSTYLSERFPNDHHISSTVSAAFFLERNETMLGMDFQQILHDRKIPDAFRQQLEEHFTNKARKNPRTDAFGYERSLRLLIEYLSGDLVQATRQHRDKPVSHMLRESLSSAVIPKPSAQIVTEYLSKWNTLSGYKAQEEALNLLFCNTFPNNTNLSEVLIKCSTLNDFYGTNIFSIYPIAQHIINLAIDSQLARSDLLLVNEIATGHGIKSKVGKELYLFSFATKYCSHHNPEAYPIYDSYVEQLLLYFRNTDGFSDFTKDELRNYPVFKQVILDFRSVYSLESFTLKQIDQYLWQLGKEAFPKNY